MKVVVGVDPGTTVGLAVFDLYGKNIFLDSKRDAGVDWVAMKILDIGDPIIIATDVNPVPKFVRRISSLFSAKVFYPKSDIPVYLKESLTKGLDVKDDHQRDAAAAALSALRFYSQLFKKVDEEVSHLGVADEVKAGIVLGKFPNVREAVKFLTMPIPVKPVREKKRRREPKISKYIEEMKKKYARLVAENMELRRRLEQLRRVNKDYIHRIVEKKTEKLRADNEQLRKIIEKMKNSFSLNNLVEVVRIKNYGREEVLKHDLKGRVVLVEENKGNVENLSKAGVRVVLSKFPIESEIPSEKLENVNLIKVGNKLYMRKEDVENIVLSDPLRWLKFKRGLKDEKTQK